LEAPTPAARESPRARYSGRPIGGWLGSALAGPLPVSRPHYDATTHGAPALVRTVHPDVMSPGCQEPTPLRRPSLRVPVVCDARRQASYRWLLAPDSDVSPQREPHASPHSLDAGSTPHIRLTGRQWLTPIPRGRTATTATTSSPCSAPAWPLAPNWVRRAALDTDPGPGDCAGRGLRRRRSRPGCRAPSA